MKNPLRIGLIGFTTVGLLAGTFFGNYIADKLFNKDRRVNPGIQYTNTYIANCDTILLRYKKLKDTSTCFKVRGHGSVAYVNLDKYWFYSDARKKYFLIMNFHTSNNETLEFYSFMSNQVRDTIMATVNKQELNDPAYGSSQKPVPILYLRALKSSYPTFYSIITGKTDPWNGDERKYKSYKLAYNVDHYLSYVKSKADFDRMFGIVKNKK